MGSLRLMAVLAHPDDESLGVGGTLATYAAELSERAGNGSLARMARGNVANALLQLRRIREALAIFEALAHDQAEAGETEMASISLQNVEACRTYLARTS